MCFHTRVGIIWRKYKRNYAHIIGTLNLLWPHRTHHPAISCFTVHIMIVIEYPYCLDMNSKLAISHSKRAQNTLTAWHIARAHAQTPCPCCSCLLCGYEFRVNNLASHYTSANTKHTKHNPGRERTCFLYIYIVQRVVEQRLTSTPHRHRTRCLAGI